MAGAILERELTPTHNRRVEFAVANRSDDAEIRRLLRENPMAGRISVSLEREPDYFADADFAGEEKQTIVARLNGRIVCVGNCAIRQRFINGTPRRVGYLSSLRLDNSHLGRFDIVRRGYGFFRELQEAAPADFYFTSVASDNERARKLLEYGLPGMPRYEFIGEFVTAILGSRGTGTRAESRARSLSREEIAALLNERSRSLQLAAVWTAEELASLDRFGCRAEDFHFIEANGQFAGAAIWDQRSFKQVVVRGYGPWLKQLRPAYNFAARMRGQQQLPEVGACLSSGFVSHLVSDKNKSEILIQLISDLRTIAAKRSIAMLALGFAQNDPRLEIVTRHFHHRQYRSRLYIVRWAEIGGAAAELKNSILAPEIAFL